MLAAVHTRYGPPDVVQVMDVPLPTVRDDEVLVQVRATTVNRTDCGFRGGAPVLRQGVHRADAADERPSSATSSPARSRRVGTAVTRFAVGDRVFGYDDTAFGAHAEYLTIGEDRLARPDARRA